MNHATRAITDKVLSIACIATTLFLCSQPVKAMSRSVEMHIPDPILAQYIKGASNSPKKTEMTLPLLRVFAADGALIAEISGFNGKRQLRHELLQAMHRKQPVEGAAPLDAYLRNAVTTDDEKYQPGSFQDADFVLVENWASWCAPCTLQHKTLQKFLASKTDRAIVLVHLETDLMRAVRNTGGTVIDRTH